MPKTNRLASLADLRDRCTVDQSTGCWHWTGRRGYAKNGQGTPVLYVVGMQGAQALQTALPMLATGRPRPEGVKYVPTCGMVDCLNWEHRRPGTLSEVLQLGAKKHAAARAEADRRNREKLSAAQRDSWARRKAEKPSTGPKLHDMLDPMGAQRGVPLTGLRKAGSNARPIPAQRPAPTEPRITGDTKVTVCPSGADHRYTVRALPPGYVSALNPRECSPWAEAAAGGGAA
jgi:hypothetical protein